MRWMPLMKPAPGAHCGWLRADAKAFEPEDTFLQRVEGIMTLYGAIVQVLGQMGVRGEGLVGARRKGVQGGRGRKQHPNWLKLWSG